MPACKLSAAPEPGTEARGKEGGRAEHDFSYMISAPGLRTTWSHPARQARALAANGRHQRHQKNLQLQNQKQAQILDLS